MYIWIALGEESGLDAESAGSFVRVASQFEAEVYVKLKESECNGKSISGLIQLEAPTHSRLQLTARGADAPEALAALQELIARKFDRG